jgi:hypothetical protein
MSTMLIRNGTRQPHSRNAAPGETTPVMRAMTPEARSIPSGTPSWGKAPARPRRLAGACSTAMRTAPPHSPPAETPWMMRRSSRRMGAAIPICENVGRTPMSVVAAPMRMSVITSIARRPITSPKWPARNAPSGRKRKLMPTVAKESRRAMSLPAGLKNSSAKTRAAPVA